MSCIRCAEAPLCEAQSFSKRKRTEARIQMRTRFCEAILRKRIRKTETNFLLPELHFAVQDGAGGMHGGFFGGERQKFKI